MKDHHVDRPGVYVRQRTQLTGPNRPIGSIHKATASVGNQGAHMLPIMCSNHPHCTRCPIQACTHQTQNLPHTCRPIKAARVHWTTWWLWRGDCTRSHPELGRENPQRPWYCVPRRGRVGRRQVFQMDLEKKMSDLRCAVPAAKQIQTPAHVRRFLFSDVS